MIAGLCFALRAKLQLRAARCFHGEPATFVATRRMRILSFRRTGLKHRVFPGAKDGVGNPQALSDSSEFT
jgi:hypothetical protein